MGKNIAASKYDKLKNKAREQQRNSMVVFEQDAYIAFLRRLSFSKWKDFFALKGGMMMLVLNGDVLRPTKDVDLDGSKAMNAGQLRDALMDILKTEIPEDDGWEFDTDPRNMDIAKDRTDRMISGAKVRFDGTLFKARIKVHIDVGFENTITPKLQEVQMPNILESDLKAKILMYPVETSIAEKFRAMVFYGADNTRLKDFYDIVKYSEIVELEASVLSQAIMNSFKRMNMEIPKSDDIDAFNQKTIDAFEVPWQGFLKKNGIETYSFTETSLKLKDFILPVIELIHSSKDPGVWKPENMNWSNALEQRDDVKIKV